MAKVISFKYIYKDYEEPNETEIDEIVRSQIERYLKAQNFTLKIDHNRFYINDNVINIKEYIEKLRIEGDVHYYNQLYEQYKDVEFCKFMLLIVDILEDNLDEVLFSGSFFDCFEYDIHDLICRVIYGFVINDNLLENNMKFIIEQKYIKCIDSGKIIKESSGDRTKEELDRMYMGLIGKLKL
jgi:hypothetical protein